MTRTVAVGFATEEMQKVYQTVLSAQQAGIAAARAGSPDGTWTPLPGQSLPLPGTG